MKTAVYKNAIGNSAEIIQNGGLVAVPTETVYGLAASGLNEESVKKIYEVKGRPSVKPLSLMVSDPEAMDDYCHDVPAAARILAERFWPGPLTIVLKAKSRIPLIVLAGGSTVGLRCPDSDLTLSLIRQSGLPLAAPSANPSGAPSPKTADEVISYFDGAIDAVIDGGPCTLGTESTILDFSSGLRVLREGVLLKDKRIIGITGQSGAGKTTALDVIRDAGGVVIDCDDLYHKMLSCNEELNAALEKVFPSCYENGSLNRKALAKIVFSDSEKLSRLNSITHDFIQGEVCSIILSGKPGLYAIDAVELISSDINAICDFTVGITAPEEDRIKRIMLRDGISHEAAGERVKAQKPEEYYLANCDRTICNNSDMNSFQKEFAEICQI